MGSFVETFKISRDSKLTLVTAICGVRVSEKSDRKGKRRARAHLRLESILAFFGYTISSLSLGRCDF
jgi:hypothetical protein